MSRIVCNNILKMGAAMQFTFTEEQAMYLLRQVENDIFALHNHIASAIENPGHWEQSNLGAGELVRKLRKAETIAANFRGQLYPVGK